MGRVFLINQELLDPRRPSPQVGGVLIEDGAILGTLPEPPGDARKVDLPGAYLAPGFLDIHFHGEFIFAEPGQIKPALDRSAASLVRHGTTGFLATTVAWNPEELRHRLSELYDGLGSQPAGAALAFGVHLEGPWIRPEAAGAQPVQGVRGYDPAEGRSLLDEFGDGVSMVTLAPEVEGAKALLEELGKRDIVAALGHSHCDGDTVMSAVERGAQHVTHLFNAMGPMHHREPGLPGTALSEDRLSCDLICDGVHVDPRMVALAARAKQEKLMLISDRIDPPSGEGFSEQGFGAGSLVDDGVVLRLASGKLAGSRTNLATGLQNFQAFSGASLLEAVTAITLAPARLLGVEDQRGSFATGARADFAVLDKDGQVLETWVSGEPAFVA